MGPTKSGEDERRISWANDRMRIQRSQSARSWIICSEQAPVRTTRRRDSGTKYDRGDLIAQVNLSREEIAEALEALAVKQRVVLKDGSIGVLHRANG